MRECSLSEFGVEEDEEADTEAASGSVMGLEKFGFKPSESALHVNRRPTVDSESEPSGRVGKFDEETDFFLTLTK